MPWFLLCLTCGAPQASPEPARVWSVDVAYERSDATLDSRRMHWHMARLQAGASAPGRGAWYSSVERHAREDLVDITVGTNAFRRLGDWTIGGAASVTPDADFLPRTSLEAQLSRRVVGTVVASAAYRRLDFRTGLVHQLQPALTWYHARGEMQARLFITERRGRDGRSLTTLVGFAQDLSARVRVSGAAARGDRIFDVASLVSARASATSLNLRLRVGITPHDFLEAAGGLAREAPAFELRTFVLTYRRLF